MHTELHRLGAFVKTNPLACATGVAGPDADGDREMERTFRLDIVRYLCGDHRVTGLNADAHIEAALRKWFAEMPQIDGRLASLSLMIYQRADGGYQTITQYTPPLFRQFDKGDNPDFILQIARTDFTEKLTTVVPLRPLFSKTLLIKDYYTVYIHIFTDTAGVIRPYVGITKQGWTSRWRQHVSAARNGSRYLVHQAIQRQGENKGSELHLVWAAGLSFEAAMEMEEGLVSGVLGPKGGSLYPRGLNMIPGGFAGLAYLGKHGFKHIGPKEWEHRSKLMREFAAHCERESKPNPLMAARWRDDEYAKSIILSNPNNFNQEQVDEIRYMASLDHAPEMIAEMFRCDLRRITQLLAGQTYSRV